MHSFSDRDQSPTDSLQVYSLEEMLAEKLRAFSGQRKFPIARDLFDIQYLSHRGVAVEAAVGAFGKKCQVKGIRMTEIRLDQILSRKEDYRANWKNQLDYLVPKDLTIPFETAWKDSLELIQRVVK